MSIERGSSQDNAHEVAATAEARSSDSAGLRGRLLSDDASDGDEKEEEVVEVDCLASNEGGKQNMDSAASVKLDDFNPEDELDADNDASVLLPLPRFGLIHGTCMCCTGIHVAVVRSCAHRVNASDEDADDADDDDDVADDVDDEKGEEDNGKEGGWDDLNRIAVTVFITGTDHCSQQACDDADDADDVDAADDG